MQTRIIITKLNDTIQVDVFGQNDEVAMLILMATMVAPGFADVIKEVAKVLEGNAPNDILGNVQKLREGFSNR